METILISITKQELQELIETIVEQKLSNQFVLSEKKFHATLSVENPFMSSKPISWLGCMADTGKITGDILSPQDMADWEILK